MRGDEKTVRNRKSHSQKRFSRLSFWPIAMDRENPRILVVGSINTDLVVTAERIPAPGETLHGDAFAVYQGGKGANQAVAAARVGGAVTMAGCLGADMYGEASASALKAEGIDVSHVALLENEVSGVALISIDAQGENAITVVAGANDGLSPERLSAVDFSQYTVALFQLETPMETVLHGLRAAREAGVTTVLTPAPARVLSAELLQYVDVLVPNEHEVLMLQDAFASLDYETAAKRLNALGVKHVLVTLGAKGVLWAHENGADLLPAFPANPVDTVGAGDCFTGVMAFEFARSGDMKAAINMGAAAGSLAVEKAGAQSSFPDRVAVEMRIG